MTYLHYIGGKMILKKVYGWHAFRIAIGMTMLGLLLAGSANAANLSVCSAGCAYSSLQDAIDNASIGDTILVQSGTYNENVNVNKQLTLRGIGNPVVKSVGSDSAIKLSANGIRLEGFDVTGASYPGEGIEITSNDNTLVENNAYDNDNNGISLFQSGNNTLIGNNAYNNGYSGRNGKYGSGISFSSSCNNTLIGNNVNYNKNDGISFSSSCNNTLIGNNATSNNDFGITFFSSLNNTLRGNNASNNGNGIILSSSGNNTLIGNNANSNNGIGISLSSSGNNSLGGNNASNNNRIGISLASSSDNMLSGNNASSNDYGISMDFSGDNLIYNNIFNNTNNVLFYGSNINTWGITKQSDTNILGGPYLGGNFWVYPNGTGFGQTCSDVNSDGICDEPFVLDENNIDYLPLSYQSASISFTNPTPVNGSNLTQNYAYINTTISGSSTAFIDWKRSLVGWWRFNSESGENPSFFMDWSKRGNNGTCSGENCPAVASGKFGNALDFDGVNDYVVAGNGSILKIKSAITIEAWINPAVAQEKCHDGVSGNYGVMSKVGGPANSENWSWQLRYGAPGGGCYLGFNFNGNPEGSRWVTVKQNLTPGQWYHIAGTFNGTDIYSYLNGDLMETNKISAIKGYRNRLIMGNDGWADVFNGKIDEVRIHRRALSPEEIKASYGTGIYRLYRNFTNLAVGSYNYQAYAQNLQGNVNQTERRTFSRVP
jgi:parallel beta-helix repeat protein